MCNSEKPKTKGVNDWETRPVDHCEATAWLSCKLQDGVPHRVSELKKAWSADDDAPNWSCIQVAATSLGIESFAGIDAEGEDDHYWMLQAVERNVDDQYASDESDRESEQAAEMIRLSRKAMDESNPPPFKPFK